MLVKPEEYKIIENNLKTLLFETINCIINE